MSTNATVERKFLSDGSVVGKWWHVDDDGRLACDLCPRACRLKPGDRGFCFVRENRDGTMVLSTYGRSTGFCIDPIEKKPLNHFFPGTSVLSFGTAGCNLGCKFCQNWDISKSREISRLSDEASPEQIAEAAARTGCHSVAFTYNDPVIWAEYAIDAAKACRDRNVRTVAVTAGYISTEARGEFFRYMDAANVDLKAFTEEFYFRITYSHLQPVLDTLVYLQRETDVWFEITNLVIPGANDDFDKIKKMCDWILTAIGPDVPVHFTAFHPDFRMMDRPHTPKETLVRAYEIAKSVGLHYPYVGNVRDDSCQSTYCPNCRNCVIQRNQYRLGRYDLSGNRCGACGMEIAGRFGQSPGTWGPRRLPIRMKDFAVSAEKQRRTTDDSGLLTSFRTAETSSGLKRNSATPSSNSGKDHAVSTTTPSETETIAPASLTSEDFDKLLRVASHLVAASAAKKGHFTSMFEELGDLANKSVMGLFITLRNGPHLRGCTGVLGQPTRLMDALSNAAYRTVLEDRRYPPVSPSEVPSLTIDVTVLGPSEPIPGRPEELLRQIELGVHGLRIAKDGKFGLLLPSVPIEHGWTVEQFFEGVCRKAGLPKDAWKEKDAELFRFEGRMAESKIHPTAIHSGIQRAPNILTPEELRNLQRVVVNNIIALLKGGTPSYYAPGIPDGTVQGIVFTLYDLAKKASVTHLIRINLRPGMPLQSSLFELAQSATQILQQAYAGRQLEMQLELTLLHDAALLGQAVKTADGKYGIDSDLSKDLETTHRAVLVMLGGRNVAVAFNPKKSADDLIREGIEALSPNGRAVTVYSMQYQSTRTELVASSAPAPQQGSGVRQPAVAGTFYPAEDHARQIQIEGFIDPSIHARTALALMTPHAGLRYSGKIATHVWQGVKIPKTVVIIGPKHTHRGVDWAVAPHRRWHLSNKVSFDVDLDLTKAIADRVMGMQLDVAAHQSEHGVEVQLPILERLAPTAHIVAIAMATGGWDEIQEAARQLAQVLKEQPQLPLLAISSDMNHYAEDHENRRRDRLALNAFKTGDPKHLLETCQEHDISMCGVVPAALVLQTLHELGKSFVCLESGYATSADAGGDGNRVVGYAGVIIAERN